MFGDEAVEGKMEEAAAGVVEGAVAVSCCEKEEGIICCCRLGEVDITRPP